MPPIPRDRVPDASLALLRDGYEFISKRCDRHDSDVFATRLLLERTICLRGAAAAEVFYDTTRFRRADAAPRRLRATLFGEGGVQALDGAPHRTRKALLLDLLSGDGVDALTGHVAQEWHAAITRWERRDRIVLFDESMVVLCRAVCAWAGVPLPEAEVARRTDEMAAMIDAPAAVGPRQWRGRRARRSAERWIGDLVERVRAGTADAPAGSALARISTHRDDGGNVLAARTAAVEVLNVLRPTVAIARFVVFAALALHEHPDARAMARDGSDDDVERFVQEVRRRSPFFPLVAGRVDHDFTWRGYDFPDGTRVLLDLYGTDHDARRWERPGQFDPERFRTWGGSAYDFIPQGGGNHRENHRCAGEWVTIAVLRTAATLLTRAMDYDVPEQDLRIDLGRIPAIPASRFVISRVRARHRPPARRAHRRA